MTSEGSGVLRIIDLAGSERASKTTFEGGDFFQRRQEAININQTVCVLYSFSSSFYVVYTTCS